MRTTTYRRRAAQLLAVISAVAGVMVFVASGTSGAQVAPITDYEVYPPPLPATCTASGSNVVIGEQFTAGGVTVTDLRNLVVAPGQTITMTWEAFAPGCEGVGVGISTKIAPLPVFDRDANYWLEAFAYCGPELGAEPCGPGPYQLSVAVPTLEVAPCYQIDAHVGPPLGVVGPAGTYYGPLNGVRDMLVSALNGGQPPCEPLPPCPTDPTLPAGAYLCVAQEPTTTTTEPAPTTTEPTTTTTEEPPPTTTTVAPSPTTTEAPPPTTTTVAPSPTTTEPTPTPTTAPGAAPCPYDASLPADSPACQPCPTNPALPAGSPDCVQVEGTQVTVPQVGGGQLPFTGRSTSSMAVTGALLLLSGLCIAFAYRRPAGAASSS